MRKYLSLTKVMIKSGFSMGLYNREKKVRSILLMLLVGVSLLIALGVLFFTFYMTFSALPEELDVQFLSLLIAGGQIGSTLLFLFLTFGIFGQSRDLPLLLSLPISPYKIFAARFTSAYLYALLQQCIFTVPLFAAYVAADFCIPTTIASTVYIFFMPILPLCIAVILTLLTAQLTRKFKGSDMMSTVMMMVLYIGFFVGMQVLAGKMSSLGSSSAVTAGISSITPLIDSINRIFPFGLIAAKGIELPLSKDVLPLFFMMFCFLVLVGVVIYFGGRFYSKDIALASNNQSNGKAGKVSYKSSTPFFTLAKREWRVIYRTPMFAFNILGTPIIVPLFMMIPMLQGNDIRGLFSSNTISSNIMFIILVAIFAFFCSIDVAASSAISREGRAMALCKTLPISPFRQLLPKIFIAQLINMFSVVMAMVVALFVFKIDLHVCLLAVIVSFFISFASIFPSLIPDLYRPKLNWSTEQEVMKQNMNVLWGMLLSMLFLLPYVVICIFFNQNLLLMAGTMIVVSIVISAIMLSILPKMAKSAYNSYSI